MLGIHRAAEELERVVEAVQRLEVVDRRAAADGGEGEGVELLGVRGAEPGELDADVAQRAAVVGVVVAAGVVDDRVAFRRVPVPSMLTYACG